MCWRKQNIWTHCWHAAFEDSDCEKRKALRRERLHPEETSSSSLSSSTDPKQQQQQEPRSTWVIFLCCPSCFGSSSSVRGRGRERERRRHSTPSSPVLCRREDVPVEIDGKCPRCRLQEAADSINRDGSSFSSSSAAATTTATSASAPLRAEAVKRQGFVGAQNFHSQIRLDNNRVAAVAAAKELHHGHPEPSGNGSTGVVESLRTDEGVRARSRGGKGADHPRRQPSCPSSRAGRQGHYAIGLERPSADAVSLSWANRKKPEDKSVGRSFKDPSRPLRRESRSVLQSDMPLPSPAPSALSRQRQLGPKTREGLRDSGDSTRVHIGGLGRIRASTAHLVPAPLRIVKAKKGSYGTRKSQDNNRHGDDDDGDVVGSPDQDMTSDYTPDLPLDELFDEVELMWNMACGER